VGQREFNRAERVGDQLQRELAALIRSELEDPRVGAVTVTGVECSRDLAHARVYVATARGEDPAAAIAALNHAAGFLRARLGRRVRLRSLPRLRFLHDVTLERAERIDALIEQGLGRGVTGERER